MKFLADENIPKASIDFLKDHGFDIGFIGMDHPSIKDQEVMQLAVEQGRTIITLDRDFGELVFKENIRPEQGIIYLRLSEYAPSEPGEIVHSMIHMEGLDLHGRITVYDVNGIRQRKY